MGSTPVGGTMEKNEQFNNIFVDKNLPKKRREENRQKIEEYLESEKEVRQFDKDEILHQEVLEDVDIEKEIENSGFILEVGGPTLSGYGILDCSKIDRKLWVSNIEHGLPFYSDQPGVLLGHVGRVDFQADAINLPVKSESIGTLFTSCLPGYLIKNLFNEARRVLKEKGFFVCQGLYEDELFCAVDYGFKIIKTAMYPEDVYAAVFQKK